MRALTTTSVVLLLSASLAACSSAGSEQPGVVASATASSAAASTAPPSSTQPAASASATSTPVAVVLPASVLRPIDGLDYQKNGDDQERLQALVNGAARPDQFATVVEGAIARELTYKGSLVGGVELIRFREEPPADVVDDIVREMVGEFGQGTPTASTLGSVRVWQIDKSRGTKIGAVAWMTGTDVVLVWSSGVDDARKIGAAYLR
jgi:hypothetical protein